MQIPFIDLKAQYQSIRTELDNHIKEAIHSFQFSRGKAVSEFETTFAKQLNIRSCIATGNGTDSLFIALKALGIGPGDEVITPAFTWISSAEVISLCGATPVFVDVETDAFTLDPQHVPDKITARTKAIIVVHLYGQLANMQKLKNICRDHKLPLIEDCAQAHFTGINGQYAGTFGTIGAFSFYPTKNLGAFGDAGALVTNDETLAQKMRRLANHGALDKDDHLIEGLNSRMDTIQASVLLAKLPYLARWNEKRLSNARLYNQLLENVPEIKTPVVRKNTNHTFHLYVIRAAKRNALKDFLLTQGIQTLIHYPQALPNLPAYAHLKAGSTGNFPVSNRLQAEVLSLPVYPELEEKSILYIAEKIRAFYKSGQ